jgi:hypothetical protein
MYVPSSFWLSSCSWVKRRSLRCVAAFAATVFSEVWSGIEWFTRIPTEVFSLWVVVPLMWPYVMSDFGAMRFDGLRYPTIVWDVVMRFDGLRCPAVARDVCAIHFDGSRCLAGFAGDVAMRFDGLWSRLVAEVVATFQLGRLMLWCCGR